MLQRRRLLRLSPPSQRLLSLARTVRVTSFGRKEPGEGQTTLVRAESTGTESHYTLCELQSAPVAMTAVPYGCS